MTLFSCTSFASLLKIAEPRAKQDRQDKFNEALIEAVCGFPCLHQHDQPCYNDFIAKDNSWAEIAKKVYGYIIN